MLSKKLITFLKDNNVRYDIVKHPLAYTALTTAEASHISGKMMAKTVIIKIDNEFNMFVLPAGHLIDMEAMREIFGTQNVRIAGEDEFSRIFNDCEPGGMSPFGNLYGLPVYVSGELSRDDEIAFNAGDHSKIVMMSYRDYDRLVHPHIMNFGL